ncbi:class I SAM-dependent DNA methyltransferase [Paenibacillus thalictri]|uniref:Class I SAM-dependent methyltransferase n=1 Tax=Paenibacillus thalictri TaxID=2527873 RepID=A0A4Q9DP33_9BACL|nr:class I SAM-dependent methyltransferase [Paenibacillus thalictri]TBL75372.1 class I SAM-dependent methyltransferase [Paenibacillus thalictri]
MAYEQFAFHYDRLMEDMPYPEWVEFAQKCWSKYGRPATVVDLGCGTGTISLRLAELGMKVTGIDLSEEMLSIAAQKADLLRSEKVLPAESSLFWLQQDMREWEIPEQVDAVISFCDCLNYLLEEEEVEAAIHRAYDALKPGGVFLFDVHTPGQLIAYAENQPFMLNDDDIAYIWTCDFDASRCEIEHALTIFIQEPQAGRADEIAGGDKFRRIEEQHVQRAYPLHWLKQTLQGAGFSEVDVYADFTFSSPNDESQRAFFAAVKR